MRIRRLAVSVGLIAAAIIFLGWRGQQTQTAAASKEDAREPQGTPAQNGIEAVRMNQQAAIAGRRQVHMGFLGLQSSAIQALEDSVDTKAYLSCLRRGAVCRSELATAVNDALSNTVDDIDRRNPELVEKLLGLAQKGPDVLVDEVVRSCDRREEPPGLARLRQVTECAVALRFSIQLGFTRTQQDAPEKLYVGLDKKSVPEAQLLLQLHSGKPVENPATRENVLRAIVSPDSDARVVTAGLDALARPETRREAGQALDAVLTRGVSELGTASAIRALGACGAACFPWVAKFSASDDSDERFVAEYVLQLLSPVERKAFRDAYPNTNLP